MKWLRKPPAPIVPARTSRWGIVLLLALVAGALAMYQSTVSLSYETLVFNQVTAPTISPVPTSSSPGTNCRAANTACAIQNTGMGAHWLKYCIVGGTVNSFAMELEGSDDNVSWMQASNQDTSLTGTSGCGVLEAAGYFQYLRANLMTFSGVSPVLTAWYSGIGTAIPGGGIILGNKTSQPVTFVPDSTYVNTSLKSTPDNLASTPVSIDAIIVGNPNAAVSYIRITSTTPANAVYPVAANSVTTLSITRGVQTTGASTIGCATAPSGAGDPGAGCVVTVHYKPFTTVNTQINAAGAVQKSGPQIGN